MGRFFFAALLLHDIFVSKKPMVAPSAYSRFLFVTAFMLSISTLLLMIAGGIVHGTGSSLACPDWPTCYGTFFPEMTGGVFFEHSHRILGTVVGLLSLTLCISLFVKRVKGVKWWGLLAVFLVIFQGVLGGITVLYRLPTPVSTAHLATSMLFLALTVYLTFRLRPPTCGFISNPDQKISRFLIGMALVLLYLQIVLGALMRHSGAGLACLDFPLCQGAVWPEGSVLVKMHMLHRIFALVVATAVILIGILQVLKHPPALLRSLAWLLILLVGGQILLGYFSVHYLLGVVPVTAHLAVGALLWAGLCLLYFLSDPSHE